MGRHLVGVLAAASLAFGLAACGGDDEAVQEPTASESASPGGAADDTPSGKIETVPDLAEGWDGVLEDVQVEECPVAKGSVTAQGTVVNSAKKPRDIVIVVSWNAPETTDPLLQLTTTKKKVPAGDEVDWSVSGDLPDDAGQCIVLARSGSLKKN